VAALIRRFPQRLRERRFWAVQALVLIITALHWELEATEVLGEHEALSFVPVSFYFIPIVYAGLNFGMEGALPTALWSAALALPNVFVWHDGIQRLGEFLQLAIMVSVAIVVARRVDLETKQRRRAEKTSASLSLLNEIGESLSHTLDVEDQLPRVLRRLLSGLPLEATWLYLEPESPGGDLLVMEEVASGASAPGRLARELHERVSSMGGPIADGHSVAVPLLMEAGVLGSLGATVSTGETASDEQVELLMTVAGQVSVAVENARLYRQRQESLQSYVRQVTQAQEDERLRIARDLHDETAQELVGLVRHLEQLSEAAGPALAEPTSDLLKQARSTLRSVRRYSRDLRPSVLDDLGLIAGIEMVVEETNGRLSAGARLEVIGKPRRVDAPVELALFRIAQEALRNVEKHADATSALVELDFAGEEIRLSVTDDGAGFSPPKSVSDLALSGKLGLLGMKERAELVGGSFEIHASPHKGTRLVVRVRPSERSTS
jgi:signal transduction histidine kinase